jgi:hypothetical protein
MKKTILLIAILWFVTSIVSCKKDSVVDNHKSSQIITTILITSPLNNSTITDSVLIITTTTNDSDIVKVEFYIDGNLDYTCSIIPWQYNWNVHSLTPNTNHTIQAKAFTKSNDIVLSQLVSVNIQQTVVPTISVTSPLNNSFVTDSVLITTSITNDSGIVKAEFYIDGVLTNTCSQRPWQSIWNVRSLPLNTTHTIQVKAYTKANNIILSQIVNVIVQQTQEFIYPLAVGNAWIYHAYLESHTTAIVHAPYETGIHTWTVTSQSFSNDSIFYRVEVAIQDTQRYRDDTSYVAFNTTKYQFTITKTGKEYIVNNEILKNDIIKVPRYVLVGTDSVVVVDPNLIKTYKFVSNLGLLSFSYVRYGNSMDRDSLNLISFIKK